jgi:hypothetical protein
MPSAPLAEIVPALMMPPAKVGPVMLMAVPVELIVLDWSIRMP